MAQDAFRRFAADVVAPQAEALHRHDLTVPESLLQPDFRTGEQAELMLIWLWRRL